MDMSDLIKAIIGLAVGSIGTYLGLYWKIQKSLIAEYDKVLRADRTKCYAALWAATEPLAIYAPPGPVTGDSVRELSVVLRHWYFATGGIFLSEKARDAYFMLQKAIASTPCTAGVAQIAPEQLAVLRKASTDLRTVLTADVGSRNKPMLQNRHEI